MSKISLSELSFGVLQPSDGIENIDCTELNNSDPLLVDDFVHNHARLSHDSKLTTVYVVRYKKKIVGCFSVSMFVIKAKKLEDKERISNSPIKSYPALLLG